MQVRLVRYTWPLELPCTDGCIPVYPFKYYKLTINPLCQMLCFLEFINLGYCENIRFTIFDVNVWYLHRHHYVNSNDNCVRHQQLLYEFTGCSTVVSQILDHTVPEYHWSDRLQYLIGTGTCHTRISQTYKLNSFCLMTFIIIYNSLVCCFQY
jgi:hypothetical protein